MLHGAGGSVMHELVKKVILKYFESSKKERFMEVPLEALDDAAVVGDIVFKSDSHAVKPIFFPGGDIGCLAISGTVNDISVLGAKPLALACGLVLEEGILISDLKRILRSMRETCIKAKVNIVTGDTKVVEKGKLGGCIINVSGIGNRTEELENNINVIKKFRKDFGGKWILDSNLDVGDKLLLSGTIGDHGISVLSAQEGYSFGSEIISDTKPLNSMIIRMLGKVGGIVSMKDPTRGGIADALNEFSEKSRIGILINENKIPIRKDVKAACEMLGLDPLEVGNEGKIIIGVVKEKAEDVLKFLKSTSEGKEAEIIGETTTNFKGVAMQTIIGGKRIISRPIGDPIPRIC
jgi:hydrogenase expression/formation protein HypE